MNSISQNLSIPATIALTNNILKTGRNFITFLGRNTGNLIGTALAVALVANQWFVVGAVLLATCSYNILSNAITSFPSIPLGIRDYFSRNLIIAATATLGCALIATQCHVIGISILLFTAYQFLDSNGFIPRKASLMIERYFPLYSIMQHPVLSYSPFDLLSASSYIAQIPPIARVLYSFTDNLVRKFFQLNGPSVQDAQGDPNRKQRFSLDEMYQALEKDDTSYQLDLEHCSLSADSYVPDLKNDYNFEKLQNILKKFSWEDHINEIFTHKNFISYLEKEFPWESREAIKKNPATFAGQLAKSKGLSTKEFAKAWVQGEMDQLMRMFSGSVGIGNRASGYQSDFDDAIQNMSKSISFLEKSCRTAKGEKEAKEMLLKLTLQGSGKQAEKIKKVSQEILHKAAQHHLQTSLKPDRPAKIYEFKVRSKLQDQRLAIIQGKAQNTANRIGLISKEIVPKLGIDAPDSLKEISEFFTDFHRSHLTFGFLPLSEHDRNHCNLPWQYFFRFINACFDFVTNIPAGKTSLEIYRSNVYEAFNNSSDSEFWSYIDKVMDTNSISYKDKQELYQKFKTHPERETTKAKFRRLALVSLGILKPVNGKS